MSRKIGLDALNLRPTPRLGHTEYSLEMNSELMRKVTGLDPAVPENAGPCYRRFRDALDFDFIWAVHDGPVDWSKGRTTDMGHAVYMEGGVDRREALGCPFENVEEVYAFDPVKEYGLPTMAETVRCYEDWYQSNQAGAPEQVITGGYYKTVISGAIQTFGWDMLLTAAADPQRFATVLRRFGQYTLHFAKAWAQTSIEAYIQHDDMVWTEGPFIHPRFYREVIFPIFRELWVDLRKAGKRVLFCSDGTFDMFMEEVTAAGAQGFIFEPTNNLDAIVARFGRTHVLVGSKLDCRTMTFGTWDKVKAEIDATLALAKSCPGFFFAVGNHIPPNVPTAMVEQAMAHLRANWWRTAR